MVKKLILSLLAAAALFVTCSADAGNNNLVTEVYSCGDFLLIQTDNVGWIYVRVSDVGDAQAARIEAIALSLLTSGKHTGYFNQSSTADHVCGVDAYKFGVLAIKAT